MLNRCHGTIPAQNPSFRRRVQGKPRSANPLKNRAPDGCVALARFRGNISKLRALANLVLVHSRKTKTLGRA